MSKPKKPNMGKQCAWMDDDGQCTNFRLTNAGETHCRKHGGGVPCEISGCGAQRASVKGRPENMKCRAHGAYGVCTVPTCDKNSYSNKMKFCKEHAKSGIKTRPNCTIKGCKNKEGYHNTKLCMQHRVADDVDRYCKAPGCRRKDTYLNNFCNEHARLDRSSNRHNDYNCLTSDCKEKTNIEGQLCNKCIFNARRHDKEEHICVVQDCTRASKKGARKCSEHLKKPSRPLGSSKGTSRSRVSSKRVSSSTLTNKRTLRAKQRQRTVEAPLPSDDDNIDSEAIVKFLSDKFLDVCSYQTKPDLDDIFIPTLDIMNSNIPHCFFKNTPTPPQKGE